MLMSWTAVTMTTGRLGCRAWIRSSSAMPFTSFITMSVSTRLKLFNSSASRASRPPDACSTVYPWRSKAVANMVRTGFSSSTTRIRATLGARTAPSPRRLAAGSRFLADARLNSTRQPLFYLRPGVPVPGMDNFDGALHCALCTVRRPKPESDSCDQTASSFNYSIQITRRTRHKSRKFLPLCAKGQAVARPVFHFTYFRTQSPEKNAAYKAKMMQSKGGSTADAGPVLQCRGYHRSNHPLNHPNVAAGANDAVEGGCACGSGPISIRGERRRQARAG